MFSLEGLEGVAVGSTGKAEGALKSRSNSSSSLKSFSQKKTPALELAAASASVRSITSGSCWNEFDPPYSEANEPPAALAASLVTVGWFMLVDRLSKGFRKGWAVLADTAAAFGFLSCWRMSPLCLVGLFGGKNDLADWLLWGGPLASYLSLALANMDSKTGEDEGREV